MPCRCRMAPAPLEDAGARSSALHELVAGWEASGARLYLTCFLALHAEAELDHSERAADLLGRALEVVETTGERF